MIAVTELRHTGTEGGRNAFLFFYFNKHFFVRVNLEPLNARWMYSR